MSARILYTIFVLILFIIIYLIITNKDNNKHKNKHNSRYNSKAKENSLTFIIVTGIIAAIIGNLLIPSDISLFDIFEYIKDKSDEAENFSPRVTLSLKPLNLINTDECDLTATTSPDDCEVNWSSDNENIVIIDDNGHLKAVAEGDTIITASIIYKDVEYSDRCNVSVKSPFINVDSFHLLYIGETKNISAEVFPENTNIIWDSNNTNIVSIDENGKIEGISEGTATITASIIYNNITYSAYCDVEVKIPEINLDLPQLLYIGETKNISAITIPENIKISWSSSNSNIVTVNDNGEIEGISEGTATITATMVYNNIDYSANHNITIKAQLDEYGDNSEVEQNNDLQKSESNTISIRDVAWLDDEKIYKDDYATTMRGEEWSDCIRFGSSNINSDGTSVLRVVCDQKYSKFTAEIAPQEGFDKTETVTFYIYGGTGDVQTFKEEYQIDYSTKSFKVEIDLTNTDELYFWKSGNYNQGRIAGQYINGYTGMGVLMRDAVLYE